MDDGAQCAFYDFSNSYEEQLGLLLSGQELEHVAKSKYQGVDVEDLGAMAAFVHARMENLRTGAAETLRCNVWQRPKEMGKTSSCSARKMIEALKWDTKQGRATVLRIMEVETDGEERTNTLDCVSVERNKAHKERLSGSASMFQRSGDAHSEVKRVE